MEVSVFLLCYNESALLPHTIKHYRHYLPNCSITIYDNESTDNSVILAKSLGCNVISWSSNNIIDDFKYIEIKNNCWKSVKTGWVIVADMDEFLCVTEQDLVEETNNNVSVLTVNGVNMIGESGTLDLTDIDLETIQKYSYCPSESKSLCFFREKVTSMNYQLGAHNCRPKGRIVFSKKIYTNKHMNFLGLEYYADKSKARHSRSEMMRRRGIATHYTNCYERAKSSYLSALTRSLNNFNGLP